MTLRRDYGGQLLLLTMTVGLGTLLSAANHSALNHMLGWAEIVLRHARKCRTAHQHREIRRRTVSLAGWSDTALWRSPPEQPRRAR